MKLISFTIFALVVVVRGEAQIKRGAQQTYSSAQAPATAIAYTKVQQPVQKVVAQPQFYAQAAAPAAYSLPAVHQQYQPQAVAYSQPALSKYAAASGLSQDSLGKVAAYRQPYSSANDVSSFAYSSPFVSYNNLGLLSQVVGKLATAQGQVKAAAPAAPSQAVYQAQVQAASPVQYSSASPVQYSSGSPAQYSSAAPVQYSSASAAQYSAAPAAQRYSFPATQQSQRVVAAAPQQYLAQIPQQYLSQTQAYQASPAAQTYSAYNAQSAQALTAQAAQASQAYTAQASQSVPQSIYSQVPQLYSAQFKQVSSESYEQ